MSKEQLKWLLDEINNKIDNAQHGSVCVTEQEKMKDLILEALTK